MIVPDELICITKKQTILTNITT